MIRILIISILLTSCSPKINKSLENNNFTEQKKAILEQRQKVKDEKFMVGGIFISILYIRQWLSDNF